MTMSEKCPCCGRRLFDRECSCKTETEVVDEKINNRYWLYIKCS